MLSINCNCPDKWYRTLPINWNCPENYFHRVSIYWNCLNNWCRVLSNNWNCPDKWSRTQSINWNCPANCFQRLSINWNCLNNWCLVLSTNWNCPDKWSWRPSIRIFLKIVFTGCLLIEISWTIDFGWCTWIDSVGTTVETTAFRDRPLIGIIRTIEFWKALLFENRQLLLCRVQLIDLISTLQYHAIIASLTGWTSSLYTQPFARYILMHYALVWIVSI